MPAPPGLRLGHGTAFRTGSSQASSRCEATVSHGSALSTIARGHRRGAALGVGHHDQRRVGGRASAPRTRAGARRHGRSRFLPRWRGRARAGAGAVADFRRPGVDQHRVGPPSRPWRRLSSGTRPRGRTDAPPRSGGGGRAPPRRGRRAAGPVHRCFRRPITSTVRVRSPLPPVSAWCSGIQYAKSASTAAVVGVAVGPSSAARGRRRPCPGDRYRRHPAHRVRPETAEPPVASLRVHRHHRPRGVGESLHEAVPADERESVRRASEISNPDGSRRWLGPCHNAGKAACSSASR